MFILGKKIGMTQIFQEDGIVVPVTLIEAGPVTVTQVRTKEKDGYEAVQVGYGKEKKPGKTKSGHLKDLASLKHLKETKILSDKKEATLLTSHLLASEKQLKFRVFPRPKDFKVRLRGTGFTVCPPATAITMLCATSAQSVSVFRSILLRV